MCMAVEWTTAECGGDDKVVICTDSQSLCKAIEGANPDIDVLRCLLAACTAKLVIQWIPGHSDIPGNELADQAAKEATTIDEPPGPVSYGSACTLIKEIIIDAQPQHERIKAVYSTLSKKRETLLVSREAQVHLARLRSGHHMALRAYKHRIDNTTDPSCPRCDAPEHTLEHWLLECPGVLQVKNELFEEPETGLEILTSHPKESVTLARRTLLGVLPARVSQG